MTRAPFKRRWHPSMGETRSLDKARRDMTDKRAAFVNARIDSHGADGLNDWLRDNGVLAWGNMDGCEALAIIRRRLGVEVWRAARDVVGIT